MQITKSFENVSKDRLIRRIHVVSCLFSGTNNTGLFGIFTLSDFSRREKARP